MDMNAHADSMRLPGFGTIVRLDMSRVLPMTGMATLAGIAVALAFCGLGSSSRLSNRLLLWGYGWLRACWSLRPA